MSNRTIWVYRRHMAFKEIGIGWQKVTDGQFRRLIADGCGQDPKNISDRQLKEIDPMPYVPPKPKAVKEPATVEEEPKLAPADEETAKMSPRRRTYKRRDIKPED